MDRAGHQLGRNGPVDGEPDPQDQGRYRTGAGSSRATSSRCSTDSDRAMVYRFHPDGPGGVRIAEVAASWTGVRFWDCTISASDIPARRRARSTPATGCASLPISPHAVPLASTATHSAALLDLHCSKHACVIGVAPRSASNSRREDHGRRGIDAVCRSRRDESACAAVYRQTAGVIRRGTSRPSAAPPPERCSGQDVFPRSWKPASARQDHRL